MTRLLIIISCLIGVVLSFSYLSSPTAPKSTQKISFVIKPGQDVDQITKLLKEKNLIRSVPLAKFLILQKGLSKKIQAGYFYFSPSQNIQEIILGLTKAASEQLWITIPEGIRRQETALIIEKSFGQANPNFNATDFISASRELEGRLFPETYALSPNSNTEQVISKLTDQFDQVVEKLKIPQNEINNTLILASLLERESRGVDEMLEIAGILKKRLNANWPLQIDATVQFALANQQCKGLSCDYWPDTLTKQDLKITSPYNTYNHIGLPPGPIASPGEQALKAAFTAPISDYWFYLHDLTGKAHFAKTIEEHNQNICIYLKKDCN